MNRFLSILGKTIALIGSLGVFYIMIATVLDVGSRLITSQSIPGTIETAEVVLVVSVFLALGFAQATRQHFAMNLVTDRIPERWSLIAQIVGLTVGVATMVLISWALWTRAIDATIIGEYRFGAVAVPIWPARIAAAFGATYFALELVNTIVKLRNGTISIRSEEVAIQARSDAQLPEGENAR